MQRSTRWHILFSGQVQFVGFRHRALCLARELGLTGFVQNLPDGRVELEVQGPVSALRQLLIRLKAQPGVRVTDAAIDVLPPVAGEDRFRVRWYE